MPPAALEWQTERTASGLAAALLFLLGPDLCLASAGQRGHFQPSVNSLLCWGGGGAGNDSIVPAWLAVLRKDVRLSQFAAVGAKVLFMWICLRSAFLVKHSVKLLFTQFDESSRSFRRETKDHKKRIRCYCK